MSCDGPSQSEEDARITNPHGVGPKALRLLRGALAERGLSFKQA